MKLTMLHVHAVRMIILALLAGGFSNAFALTFEFDRNSGCDVRKVKLSGVVEPGDSSNFNKFISEVIKWSKTNESFDNKAHSPLRFEFELRSSGGSVLEAIQIGRSIRALEGETTAYRCASACVFMHSGGVRRYVWPQKIDGKNFSGVGLHRFYFNDIEGRGAAEVRAERNKLRKLIEDFLMEMDLPQSILEVSESVAPKDIKWLTYQEVTALRLVGDDASYDEVRTSKGAKKVGLPVSEYRKRTAAADSLCKMLDFRCQESVILGRPSEEIDRLQDSLVERCFREHGRPPANGASYCPWERKHLDCVSKNAVRAK